MHSQVPDYSTPQGMQRFKLEKEIKQIHMLIQRSGKNYISLLNEYSTKTNKEISYDDGMKTDRDRHHFRE